METNTFFEAWLETQKQLTNNWTESNRKLQESVKSGAAINDGLGIYKEWLAKQAEITKKASEEAAKTFQSTVTENTEALKNGKATENFTETYTNWINAQREQMTKAFDTFKNLAQPVTSSNPFANTSMNQLQDFQQQWWNASQNWMSQANNASSQWSNPFSQWTSPFQNMGKGFSDDTMKDAWKNMTNSSAAYMKFYEMWSPVYKNMLNNSFSNEGTKNFNFDSFRELMDRTISSVSPVQTKEMIQQFQSWVEVVNNYNKHIYQQFTGSIPENFKSLAPFLAFGNDQSNAYNNVFSVYQRAISPLVRLFNPGKESELNNLVSGMMEKLSVYGQKLAELQQQMYANGAKTWEAFVADNMEQMKKGVDLSNAQEVFQKWIAKNEESTIALFKTDAYSKIQGELLDLGLEIKQHSEKIAETLLSSLPVVLRSEADELYTTIYELRKRISVLEKQNDGADAEVKEAKTSKKKTATA